MPTARLPSFLWETDRGDARVKFALLTLDIPGGRSENRDMTAALPSYCLTWVWVGPGRAAESVSDVACAGIRGRGTVGHWAGRLAVPRAGAARPASPVRLGRGTEPPPPSANRDRSAREFAAMRERAREDGIAIEVEPVANGTRLAWSVPLRAA